MIMSSFLNEPLRFRECVRSLFPLRAAVADAIFACFFPHPSLFSHHKTLFSYKRIDKDTMMRSISLHTHALNINIMSSQTHSECMHACLPACLCVICKITFNFYSNSFYLAAFFSLFLFPYSLFALVAGEDDSGGGAKKTFFRVVVKKFVD